MATRLQELKAALEFEAAAVHTPAPERNFALQTAGGNWLYVWYNWGNHANSVVYYGQYLSPCGEVLRDDIDHDECLWALETWDAVPVPFPF
jgi:hypothetical protein